MNPTTTGPVVLATGLGTLSFDLTDQEGHLAAVPHTIEVFPIMAPVVEPMTVERVTAVLLMATPPRTINEPLHFRYRCG